MKNYLIIFIIFIYSQLCFSQNQIDVLFIGNSLTGYNDMPGLFKSLSIETGKNVSVETCLKYGLALRHIIDNSSVIDKINEKNWDYIILQSDDITAFDDMYHIEINTLTKFKEYIHENCATTKIIYEMIWGLRDGVNIQGEGYYSYEQYINKIYDGTLYIANELDLIIGPVGWAWRKCRQDRPDIELFSSDKAHPAYPGSYLGACVFFNIIFGERIENNSFYGTLPESDAVFLQSIANDIVLNDLELWNYSQGTFTDIYDTKKSSIIGIRTYPNPTNGITNISFELVNNSEVQIEIINITGVIVIKKIFRNIEELEYQIDLSNQSNGLYFIRLKINNQIVVKNLIKND